MAPISNIKSYDIWEHKKNDIVPQNGNHNKRKLAKISNILNPNKNEIKSQKKNEMNIVWKCNNMIRPISVVSDDEALSVEDDDKSTPSLSSNNYDYSSSDNNDECKPFPINQQITNKNQQNIEDMTIQQMLDNLDNFEGDEVDAILAKLLPKNTEKEKEEEREEKKRRNFIEYKFE